MSETKFTKGPWKTKYYLDEDEWRVWTNDACVIAFTDQWASEFDFEVAANAHLIAAAPELYEALEALVQQRYPFRSSGGYNEKTSIDFWESEHEEGNGEAAFWIAAHDALRKARGEA